MLRNRVFKLLLAITLTVMFQPIAARAAWGDFDQTFGFGGTAIDAVTGYVPRSVKIQPDGKVLVAGYRNLIAGGKGFFLRRYLSSGQIDVLFGKNGEATSNQIVFINSDYMGEKIVVLADGKIAVAGRANGFYAVWQFTSAGVADSSFGQSGFQILSNYQSGNYAPELNIQNGKLLLTFPKTNVSGKPIVLVRLNTNGAKDITFGTLGESLTALQGEMTLNQYFGTVVESDGKITIGGKTTESFVSRGLERKLANGNTDPSFSPTSSNYAFGVIVPSGFIKLSNGKYLMLSNNSGLTYNFDKFGANGTYESSTTRDTSGGNGCPDILANQSNGKVIVGFYGRLIRMNAELDYGTQENLNCQNLNGIVSKSAALQMNDKMVVAGVSNNYLVLSRFLPN